MSIIPKIQKLLALSKSSNEHEAQAAATKAHELLAEHALSMAEVTAHDTSPVETIGEFTASSRHSSPWVRQLWGATSRAYFCTYFYYTHQHKTHHTVIGTELNSKTTCEMADYLQKTIMRLANAQPDDRGFRQGFRKGAVSRMAQRMRDMREKPSPTIKNASNLPALYAQNDKALEAYKAEHHPNLASTKNRERNTSHAGYVAGTIAANSISLNNQLGAANDRRRIT
tara:strand:- start:1047 stop:1727 length:681 start_codon:yes stop_codon:yes gene_type:complete